MEKSMKKLLTAILLFTFLIPLYSDEWSEEVNGLKGRLFLKHSNGSPFLKVFIELQNVSQVANSLKVNYKSSKQTFSVTDNKGKKLNHIYGPYSAARPYKDNLIIPYNGKLSFQISFPGLGYNPKRDKTIIDLGPGTSWSIPQNGDYFLSGSFTIEKEKKSQSKQIWSGTLKLPKIKIKKND